MSPEDGKLHANALSGIIFASKIEDLLKKVNQFISLHMSVNYNFNIDKTTKFSKVIQGSRTFNNYLFTKELI